MRPSRLDSLDPRPLGLAVFAAAFLVRAVYLLDIHANPFFVVPVIDAEQYDRMAQAFLGFGLARAPFQMPPGYPLLLSLVYRVAGPSLVAAHVLQILLGAGTTALAFGVGRRLGGATVGLVAAAFVATSKALLFLEGDLLATPLCVFLDLLALWFLVRWVEEGERRSDLLAGGLALGLSALALPLVLVVVPASVVWLMKRRRLAAAGLLVLSVVVPIVPVTVRNWRVSGGEFVPISANGGINFWMGNNPDWRRTSTLRPGPEWRAMLEIPMREAGIVPSSARDRWFQREALHDWTARPAAALGRTFEKAMLLVHNHEIMRDFDFYYFRDRFSRLLRLPGWNFALLLALAVVGLVFARSRRPGEGLLLLYLASYAFGVVLFFVTSRYRAPLVPVLAIFAAQGLVWLVSMTRARARVRVGRAAAIGAAAYVLSCIDFFGVDRLDASEAEYRIATTYEKSGRLEDALKRYDAVLEKDPEHLMAAARGAVCLQLLDRPQEAVDRYERLLERHPDYAEAAVNLATIASQHGNRDAAEHYFQLALETDPYLPAAHASYAAHELQSGDAAGAVASFAKALEYDPTWEALRVDYARALLAAGDTAGARREIEHAAGIMPPSDRIELVLGDVAQAEGRGDEARTAWTRGLRLNPKSSELRERLGQGGERR